MDPIDYILLTAFALALLLLVRATGGFRARGGGNEVIQRNVETADSARDEEPYNPEIEEPRD